MTEQGPLSGQILGEKYLIGEMLGEGGFGMVYTGRHLLLDRPQAIKLLMLAGRRPFEGSTPEAVMMKHLTEPPPPLQTLRPELPLEIAMVVEKALAKQVAQRYQSASELVLAFKDTVIAMPIPMSRFLIQQLSVV